MILQTDGRAALVPAPAVSVQEVTHRFGDREALSSVSFDAMPAEIIALLGPNGGGKTTLFRILATLLRPTSGDVRIFGHSVIQDPAVVRQRIGVVFQRPSLDPQLTVAENLRHHGNLYGMSGAALSTRVKESLTLLGLADRASERVLTLSGGLQRRVELAKALLHRPELLLLDEPNTGLDPNARREFLGHLEDLRRRDGVTVLLTTHFMEEAERCDRVGILHLGKLVAMDTPHALKAAVGGDVITIQGRQPELLAGLIARRFGVTPRAVNAALRVEMPDGHRFAADVVDAFPGEVTSVCWGQPTLDDAFVHLTGSRFEVDSTGATP